MKSDPIQGILFNTKPVLLQERAIQRAKVTRVVNGKQTVFFHKLPMLKPVAQRLTRRKKIPLDERVMQYEQYPQKKTKFKRLI